MTTDHNGANKTDAGNGSKAICRVSNVLRSPSPDPRRSPPNSMRWHFKVTEISAGHYNCVATREDGRSIECDGSDAIIPEAIRDAYLAEIAAGTCDAEASFHVTHGFLSRWSGVYHRGMMGSWTVSDPTSGKRIDFDGRDMYLMITRDSSGYSWQGGIADLSKARCHYFRELSTL